MKSGNHPSRSLCVTKIHWAIKIKLNEIVSREEKVRNIPTCQEPNIWFLKNELNDILQIMRCTVVKNDCTLKMNDN